MRTRSAAAAVALILAVALTACTPTPDGGSPKPSGTATEALGAPACAEIELTQGASIPGGALGECLQQVVALHNTYRATGAAANSQTRSSTALVRVEPFQVDLVTDDDDEPRHVQLTDSDSWGLFGTDWVKGGLTAGSDGRAQLVTILAVYSLTTFGPTAVSSLVSSATSWTVATQEPDAQGTQRWRLDPDSTPTLLGQPVSDAHILVGDDFTLYRTQATAVFQDEVTSTTQDYSDWGTELDFPPLPEG